MVVESRSVRAGPRTRCGSCRVLGGLEGWYRMVPSGYRIATRQSPLYRIHPSAVGLDELDEPLVSLLLREIAFDTLFAHV